MKPRVLFEVVSDDTTVSCVISAYAQFSLRRALVDCFGRLRILHVRLLWFWSTLDFRLKFTWQGDNQINDPCALALMHWRMGWDGLLQPYKYILISTLIRIPVAYVVSTAYQTPY